MDALAVATFLLAAATVALVLFSGGRSGDRLSSLRRVTDRASIRSRRIPG
jgi:hypothetical protein